MASGIDGIRVNFNDGHFNWAAYREIDAISSATIPEPSTALLGGLGLLALLRRRR